MQLIKAVGPTRIAILDDIQYAKTQWLVMLGKLQKAMEAKAAPHCTGQKDEEALWKTTRDGHEPWVRIAASCIW